jgi:DNA polymerase III delta prime subunit
MKWNQQHTIIVGPAGSGKSLRAHELARECGEQHAGIRCISVGQVLDLYGIELAMQDEPAVLIIEEVEPGSARVFDFLSQLAWQPTWTLQRKGQCPKRVAAPQMIVTAQALPSGWSAPDHIWRVIELDGAGMVEAA